MRVRYNQQLELLHLELIKMGTLCEDAIAAAMKALFSGDQSMIAKAVDLEKQIDEKERVIEALCMKLLLQQQPASLLRNPHAMYRNYGFRDARSA